MNAGRATSGALLGLVLVALPWVAGVLETTDETRVRSSIKAHLADGSVFVFPDGFSVDDAADFPLVRGRGYRANGVRSAAGEQDRTLPLDEIYAIEYFDPDIESAPASRTVPPEARPAHPMIRSSPVIYSKIASTNVIEAEAFSNILLRRIEADDVDKLDAGREVGGRYRLFVRNEALETHYLNAIGLMVVDHEADAEVYPTASRKLLLIKNPRPVDRATNRDGASVDVLIKERDERAFRTSPSLVTRLTREIIEDWIDLDITLPKGTREIYLVLDVRNTLFNAVLLEDALLGGRGFESLDLLSGERFRILEMWRLYRWCRKNMGLFVRVAGGDDFDTVERIGGTGPAAWRQVAVPVPTRGKDRVRIRLAFLADTWAIDRVAVSFDGRSVRGARLLSPSEIKRVSPPSEMITVDAIRDSDDDYLALYPGETYELTFDVAPHASRERTSYLISTRGYIVKWLRSGSLRRGEDAGGKLDDTAVFRAARRWASEKPDLERAFGAMEREVATGPP